MATIAIIARTNDDGSITSITLSHDGYRENCGKKLIKYYRNEERLEQLLELGNLATIEERPEQCRARTDKGSFAWEVHRPKTSADIEQAKQAHHPSIQLFYLYQQGRWTLNDREFKTGESDH